VSPYKKRAYLFGVLLGATVFLLVAVSIGLGAKITGLSNTKSFLNQQLIDVGDELKQTRTRLTETEQQLQALVEGRLPNLRTLEPDKVLKVGEHYVRNIVFTVIGNGHSRVYEYKMVMENPYYYPVYPDIRLLVFDKLGVQVGIDNIEEKLELGPGASRSYSSNINVFMHSIPDYFNIDFKTGG